MKDRISPEPTIIKLIHPKAEDEDLEEIDGGVTIEDLEAEKAKIEHVNAVANLEQAAPAVNLKGPKRGKGNREADDD